LLFWCVVCRRDTREWAAQQTRCPIPDVKAVTNITSMLYSVRLSLLVFSAIFLFSCGDPTPPAVDREDVTLDAAPEKMEEDQTRGTRNANPETVAPERLEEVKVRTKPATEQLEKAVESKMPTPERAASPEPVNTASAPSPAPAPAPEKPAVEEKEPAPATATDQRRPATGSSAPDHAPWNALLQQYVDNRGRVDYDALKRNEGELDAYLASLEKEAPQKSWSRNERLAYWLNAYNAYTFKLILNNYPTKSIMDLHGGKPWDVYHSSALPRPPDSFCGGLCRRILSTTRQ